MKITTLLFSFLMIKMGFSISLFAYDITVAQDGSGRYTTIQAAVNAIPDNKSARTVIFVKKGIYKGKVIIPSSKINITLIGEDAEKTIITYDDYNPRLVGNDTITTWTSYTIAVDAEGFVAENITFENSAGRVGQAVAVRIMADMVAFRNCRFLGNQDTLFAHGIGRIYFSNCYIEGTTDFIFGSAVALFEGCEIHSKVNSYITAASTPNGNAYGYVFKNCKFTADTAAKLVYLGRPWRAFAKTVFMNCYLGAHIRPEGWNNWQKPEREKTTYYAEYKNSGPGADTANRVKWSRQLSDAEAANYTMENIFARNSVPIPVPGLKSWEPNEKK
jgi:pectinesterase